MIFVKSLAGGVICVIVTWIALVMIYVSRLSAVNRQRPDNGLVAVAGGWGYLLQRPPVIALLAAAFGAGVYLTARWSLR